jgi:hypothetical protein
MTELAPIVLFVYNRPEHTLKTLEALSNNELANCSNLFIFADGPKKSDNEKQLEQIRKTRDVIHTRKWCQSVTIIESETNLGLASSIIAGVTEIIQKYQKVIVLEDDIVTGKGFLKYMNDTLNQYENEKQVWHITGWHIPINSGKYEACFLYPIMDCWSWATWADRWEYFNKEPERLISSFSSEMIKRFNVDGLCPKWNHVLGNYAGEVNTWAIFWYAAIFLHRGLCLAPCVSLVKNIGLDNTGVHGKKDKTMMITHDHNHNIKIFPSRIEIDNHEYNIIKDIYRRQFGKQRLFYTIKMRIPIIYRCYKFIICLFIKFKY